MPRESSRNQNEKRLSPQLHLLNEAAAGRLEDLECPTCRKTAVSVWFTHPASDTYRTWFICANCDFHTRVQNTERPQSFSQDRVNTNLEERDLSIFRQSLFRKLPRRLT